MIYAENVFICLVAPLITAIFFLKGNIRRFSVLLICGMGICLLCAYINSFFAAAFGVDMTKAAISFVPIVEEVGKLLPLLFYFLIFTPENEDIRFACIAVGIGFATFENCCYITQFGAAEFLFVLVRGFATGTMHAMCTIILGFGLTFVYRQKWTTLVGSMGLLCATISYHAIYNLLVSVRGLPRTIGYLFPFFTVILAVIILKLRERKYDNS